MKVRPLLPLPLVIVPFALGCQILYDKNDLTVAAGGEVHRTELGDHEGWVDGGGFAHRSVIDQYRRGHTRDVRGGAHWW